MASIPRFNVTGRYRMLQLCKPNHSSGETEESSVKNGSRFFASGDSANSNLTRADDSKIRPNTAGSQVISEILVPLLSLSSMTGLIIAFWLAFESLALIFSNFVKLRMSNNKYSQIVSWRSHFICIRVDLWRDVPFHIFVHCWVCNSQRWLFPTPTDPGWGLLLNDWMCNIWLE